MQLSPHFHLSEFEVSQTAARLGIHNAAPPAVVDNLRRLAEALERVRAHLGTPITITSGYRSPTLNRAIQGSAKNSAHQYGLAADLVAPRFGPPLAVARAIAESGVEFDQLIYEFGSWVHFAIPAELKAPRRALLTIDRNGTRLGIEGVKC